jgi:hypothetical protein
VIPKINIKIQNITSVRKPKNCLISWLHLVLLIINSPDNNQQFFLSQAILTHGSRFSLEAYDNINSKQAFLLCTSTFILLQYWLFSVGIPTELWSYSSSTRRKTSQIPRPRKKQFRCFFDPRSSIQSHDPLRRGLPPSNGLIRVLDVEKPLRNLSREKLIFDVLLTPEVGSSHMTPSERVYHRVMVLFEFYTSKNLLETSPEKN